MQKRIPRSWEKTVQLSTLETTKYMSIDQSESEVIQKRTNWNFTLMSGITLGCPEFFPSGITQAYPIKLNNY